MMSRDSMSDVLDCMSEFATLTQSSTLRTAWPTFKPMSHSGYSTPSMIRDKYGSGWPAATCPSCKNMKSMSLCGFNSPRP